MTDTQERSYDGCPREGLGYLHLWRAAKEYAELAETEPDATYVVTELNGDLRIADADALSLHHFFCFWGYVDGRL